MFKFEMPGFKSMPKKFESEPKNKKPESYPEKNIIRRFLKISALLVMLLGNKALGAEIKKPEQLERRITKIEHLVKNNPDKVYDLAINNVPAGKGYVKTFEKEKTAYTVDTEKRGFFIKRTIVDEQGKASTYFFIDKKDPKTDKSDGKIDGMAFVDGETKLSEESFIKTDLLEDEKQLAKETEMSAVKPKDKRTPFDDRIIAQTNCDKKRVFLADMQNGESNVMEEKEARKKLEILQNSYSSIIENINKIIESK